jgi:hypothetical protein
MTGDDIFDTRIKHLRKEQVGTDAFVNLWWSQRNVWCQNLVSENRQLLIMSHMYNE